MNNSGLIVENLSFEVTNGSGEKNVILSDINFTVKPGEFVTLFGKSGCGKSTLLNIIAGLYNQHIGNIIFNGQRIVGTSDFIGYIFQDDALLPFRTVLENIEFGLQIKGINRTERRARAEAIIEKVGLTEHRNKYPIADKLSGGTKQRVEIACLLSDHSSLILMDEPFSALDDYSREEMHRFLLKVQAEFQITILFVTHNQEEAILLSDRVLLMPNNSNGKSTGIRSLSIPLEKPRDPTSSAFNELKKVLNEHLKHM